MTSSDLSWCQVHYQSVHVYFEQDYTVVVHKDAHLLHQVLSESVRPLVVLDNTPTTEISVFTIFLKL